MKKTHRICPRTLASGRMIAALGICLSLLGSCGCRPDPTDRQADAEPAAAQTPTDAPGPSNARPDAEIWNASYIAGAKVGYDHTTVSPLTRNGRRLVRIEILSEITVRRAGQPLTLVIEVDSIETPDGKLLEFDSQLSQGPIPMQQTTGRVAGDRLQLETTTSGKTGARSK